MSGHVCIKCGSDVFTLINRNIDGLTIRSFQCMSCGETDALKEKDTGIRVAGKKVNTGIKRSPEDIFREYKPRIQDYQQLLRKWNDEWKRIVK